ncbi:MAG: helix-turn-helix domain-containing protein [Gammaproteobacteria bacterium]
METLSEVQNYNLKAKNSFCNKSRNLSCSNCSFGKLCLPKDQNSSEVNIIDDVIKHRRIVHKGENIFRHGEKSGYIYAIRSGSVKTQIPTKLGEEKILGFHLPGEIIGFDCFDNQSHKNSGIALEKSVICIFPLTELNNLSIKIQKVHDRLFSLMSEEIEKAHLVIKILAKSNPEQKLASFLINLSEKLKARDRSSKVFDLSMSRYDIGNFLGLADETVSRSFSKLREYKLVDAERKNITILDYKSLCKFSELELNMDH